MTDAEAWAGLMAISHFWIWGIGFGMGVLTMMKHQGPPAP